MVQQCPVSESSYKSKGSIETSLLSDVLLDSQTGRPLFALSSLFQHLSISAFLLFLVMRTTSSAAVAGNSLKKENRNIKSRTVNHSDIYLMIFEDFNELLVILEQWHRGLIVPLVRQLH